MARFSIENWPMSLKFGLPPAIALVMMGIISFIGNQSIDEQVSATSLITDEYMDLGLTLADQSIKLNEGKSDLFALMSLQAAELAPADSQEQFDAIVSDLRTVEDQLNQLSSYPTLAAKHEEFRYVAEELRQVIEAVSLVTQLLEIDFGAAANTIPNLRDSYDDVTSMLRTAIDEQSVVALQQAAGAKEQGEQARLTFIVTLALAVVVTLLLTLWLGGKTSGSIRLLAQTTADLAAGNRNIELEALRRRDVLGQIVDALAVFKDNITRVEKLQAEQIATKEKEVELDRIRAQEEADAQKEWLEKQARADRAAKEKRAEELLKLADEFEASVGSLIGAVSSSATAMKEQSEQLNEASKTSSSLSQEAAEDVSHTSTAVQTVANHTFGHEEVGLSQMRANVA